MELLKIDHKDIMVALEAANGFVKGASSLTDGQVDTYLNTLTESTVEEYKQYLSNEANGISGNEVYLVDGKYYKVGLAPAAGQNCTKFATRNDTKYEEPLWKVSFIIGVYRQIKNAPSLTVSKVFVTTGLPANDDKKNSIKRKLKESFVKVHCVNGQKFSIDDLFFLGQGTASFYNDMFEVNEENQLQVSKKFLASTAPNNKNSVSQVMYVDAGFSTLDYKFISDYVVRQEKSIEAPGMLSIWKSIIDELTIINSDDDEETIAEKERNEWLNNLDILEVEDQLREGKKIDWNYQEVDISKVFDKKMTEYADAAIKRLYVGEGLDNMVYDQVQFVGGGSLSLKPYLEKAYEKYHKGNKGRMSVYKFASKPQETNCKGYLKFSIAKVNKLRNQ